MNTADTEKALEESIFNIHMKCKLSFYQRVIKHLQGRKATLTADEAYCAEAIYSLVNPTIGEFAQFVQISPQSAAYKVNNLVKKGYLTKTQDDADKREYRLTVTKRFMDYYVVSNRYIFEVVERAAEKFEPEDVAKFAEMLDIIANELTPEIGIGRTRDAGAIIEEMPREADLPEAPEAAGPSEPSEPKPRRRSHRAQAPSDTELPM